MSIFEKAPVIRNPYTCPNCNVGLTRHRLSITPEERILGVYEKFQIVHITTGAWECPGLNGLTPYSDQIMPVMVVEKEGLYGSRTTTTPGTSSQESG